MGDARSAHRSSARDRRQAADGGDRQGAVATTRAYLIMDEPTAALNDAEIAELFRIIRELKAAASAIVYISHKMDELKQISDRVTVLRDGEYVGDRADRDDQHRHDHLHDGRAT